MQNIESPYDRVYIIGMSVIVIFHLSLSRNDSYENDVLPAATIFINPYAYVNSGRRHRSTIISNRAHTMCNPAR